MDQIKPERWHVAEVLKTIHSPLTLTALVEIGLVVIGYRLIGSTVSEELTSLLLCLILVLMFAVVQEVLNKAQDAKDVVLDAEYHKQTLTNLVQGQALVDRIDDRIDKFWLEQRDSIRPAGYGKAKRGPLTFKRMREELEVLDRRRK